LFVVPLGLLGKRGDVADKKRGKGWSYLRKMPSSEEPI